MPTVKTTTKGLNDPTMYLAEDTRQSLWRLFLHHHQRTWLWWTENAPSVRRSLADRAVV